MYYTEEGLIRFVSAQEQNYAQALKEIKAGRKHSHWMWYIFPQIKGLGMSYTARYYGIKDMDEAVEYMAHPLLGPWLVEISGALLEQDCSDAGEIMGYPDNLKLRSCMTLFEAAAPDQPVFGRVLDRFYSGSRDELTLNILGL